MRFERNEYPRPQMKRDEWLPLNGVWRCCFSDSTLIPDDGAFDKKINVPFTYEYEASGIGDTNPHSTVWYKRTFKIKPEFNGKRLLLCFNASDFVTDVWANGNHVIRHIGGYTPFSADITESVSESEENTLVVRCYDPADPALPRGKQSWTGKPFGCWYVPNTGIWQSVWLETFGGDCIEEYFAEPDIDNFCFSGEITTLYGLAESAEISVYLRGELFKKQILTLEGKQTHYCVKFKESDFSDENLFWSPDHPTLFGLDIRLIKDGRVIDTVHSRLGMRKISVDGCGNICLNNKKLYQRLILDQGYWKESGITPPSAEALKRDIQLARKMGFNGARKHQKIEDAYFYYYADELGFLTWCEMPSAYYFGSRETKLHIGEWQNAISHLRNFASIICYVPLNESWGVSKICNDVSQQNYARAMYFITKSMDGSRLISTNDGWENLDYTDVITIHDYSYDSSEFARKYLSENFDTLYPAERKLMAQGCAYRGQPVLFTEFGGIAFKNIPENCWGYCEGAADEKEFLARLENLMRGIYECDFQGFCYTQLTDVQQEVNGLLDERRNPKLDTAALFGIFGDKNQ